MDSGGAGQRLPPRSIVDVPLNGFVKAVFEFTARFSFQFALGKGRIDGVTAVVANAAAEKDKILSG